MGCEEGQGRVPFAYQVRECEEASWVLTYCVTWSLSIRDADLADRRSVFEKMEDEVVVYTTARGKIKLW